MEQDAISKLEARLADVERRLHEQTSRSAIIECTARFCRAINRGDKELLLSVFHPDAVDDHGFFVGGPEAFLTWIGLVYDRLSYTQHYVSNHIIEIDGAEAHAETYWIVVNIPHGEAAPIIRGGRYIDRFEERDGLWAISRRVCLMEWHCQTDQHIVPPESVELLKKSGISAMNKTDLSYQRPLEIHREHTIQNPAG